MSLRYFTRRLLESLATLWALVTIVFILGRFTGSPVDAILPADATPAARAELTHEMGLDAPIASQYLQYVVRVVHLDLGRSSRSQTPVVSLLVQRGGNTLRLAGAAAVAAIVVAIPLGVMSALKRDGWFDQALLLLSIAGQAVPSFFLALLMILLFSVQLRILPTSGITGPESYIMPTITLSTFMIAGLYRITRSSMLDVLGAEYLTFARLKGLPEMRVIFVHALRNALLAPVSFFAVYLGFIVSGTVIVETMFGWPGIGQLAYSSILSRDLPVMQGTVLVAAGGVIFSNFAADLLSAVLDPRIRY